MKNMKKPKESFTKAGGKAATGDSTPLQYVVSETEKKKALHPPVDNAVIEDIHGYKVSDPFRPLENLDAPETAAWVDAQNKNFFDHIVNQQQMIRQTTAFMEDAMNYTASSLPSRYGKTYFNTVQNGLAPQPIYQVRDSLDGEPRTLIDPNNLSDDGTVSLSDEYPSPDGMLVAYLTSKAGSDMQILRIRDVATGRDLPDVIEGCRFAYVLWDKDSHDSFQYTYPVTPGAWGRKTMHHTIGAPAAADKQIFEQKGDAAWAEPLRLRSAKYEWIVSGLGFDPNNGLHYRPLGSDEAFKTLLRPLQYLLQPVTELDNGDILALTTKDAPLGRLVRFNINDLSPEKWQDVIPQHTEDPLTQILSHQGKLFCFYTHDTADAVRIFNLDGTHLHDMPLPIQSVAGYARINEEDTSFLVDVSSFTTPGDIYRYDIASNTLDRIGNDGCRYNLDGCIVERISAISKDGTRVPMTVIRQPDTKLDGTAALKLYGYGASNTALGPGFSFKVLDWVRKGGIYVQANLRGGGEFGAAWYDGGRMRNKKNVFDDFIACAETLIEKNYTSTPRLVIEGGSAGGLLTMTAMTQRPELFGAVISAVPVTDVIRLHKTRGGQAIPEYGDPTIKEDFEAIRAYSPLHNVKPDAQYPPHLLKTGDHDNRVPPLHAFKMAALLQAKSAKGTVSLLCVDKDAGHGAGKPTAKIIQEHAETMAFVASAIGPIHQRDYRNSLTTTKVRKLRPSGRKK